MEMDMDKMVKELQKVVKFKETTEVGDLVLVVLETPLSCLYALVRGFERDQEKRDEWWRITLHLLSLPPEEVTWILRPPQFTGKEIFSMGGDKRYIKAVDLGPKPVPERPPGDQDKRPGLRLVK
jgi:hypothetical protein